jgi:hypothetical protein
LRDPSENIGEGKTFLWVVVPALAETQSGDGGFGGVGDNHHHSNNNQNNNGGSNSGGNTGFTLFSNLAGFGGLFDRGYFPTAEVPARTQISACSSAEEH